MWNIVLALALLPSLLFGQGAGGTGQPAPSWMDFAWSYRLATLADLRQTLWAKENGWLEHNRLLKRTGAIETALVMAAFCELEIRLVSLVPRKWRPIAGALAVVNRLVPVLRNAGKGNPVGFYCPILTVRF